MSTAVRLAPFNLPQIRAITDHDDMDLYTLGEKKCALYALSLIHICLAPEVKNLTRTEMTELMEHIFGLPEVQRAVRHMEITHINQANRGKELKANGTIPLHSNPNETQ